MKTPKAKSWQITVRTTKTMKDRLDAEVVDLRKRLHPVEGYRFNLENIVNGIIAAYLSLPELARDKLVTIAVMGLPDWEDPPSVTDIRPAGNDTSVNLPSGDGNTSREADGGHKPKIGKAKNRPRS